MPVGSIAAATSPPFVLRGRLLTPLGAGGTLFDDDAVVAVDASRRLSFVGAAAARPDLAWTALDLRPLLLLPGLVDLHARLPQLPNAGLGAGLDLLSWLRRYIFPLERSFDEATAERLAPAAFRAAEVHGIRAIIGKVMMDRIRYDETLPDAAVLETSPRQSADPCSRWHMRDGGPLRYAVAPRFAVSCSADMLRESADLAAQTGAYWQTHLSEDRGEDKGATGRSRRPRPDPPGAGPARRPVRGCRWPGRRPAGLLRRPVEPALGGPDDRRRHGGDRPGRRRYSVRSAARGGPAGKRGHALTVVGDPAPLQPRPGMVGTDSTFVGAKPSPRTYGNFPRILGQYVRDEALLGLEDAVRKMTGATAARLGLADRGVIRDGAAADVVVFDPAVIRNNATYEEPRRFPDGIDHVIVNGRLVVDLGEHTGALPGRALRHARGDAG